jgi:uncharacterized protein (TIGR00369 family)
MDSDDAERLKTFMEQHIPFNAFLGMNVCDMKDGEAEMMIQGRPELTGDPFRPALHGGVVSALADTVGGLAVFTLVGRTHVASTIDLRVDYLRPGQVDMDLFARAKVIRVGHRVAVTQTVVFQEDIDQPIATANAVYNMVSRTHAPSNAIEDRS